MISPLCLIRSAWRTLVYPGTLWGGLGATMSGHDLIETEVHFNCTVYVARCEDCGQFKVTWQHGQPELGYPIPESSCCRQAEGGAARATT